jgi:hypothetical protein
MSRLLPRSASSRRTNPKSDAPFMQERTTWTVSRNTAAWKGHNGFQNEPSAGSKARWVPLAQATRLREGLAAYRT